jgi:SAM-dependent methyltransferase
MLLQKIADAADWAEPNIDFIIRQRLKQMPLPHLKQWEQATIFRALVEGGRLRRDARCIGFGTGKERLIYTFADMVSCVVATDLYEPDTIWANTARTEDPQQHVLSEAPEWALADRIEALRMDMRQVDFPDNHFDFAWSTCAIEHIGEDADFIQHLNEAYRVLRDGGMYVFTTALTFEEKTLPIPGCYFFSPDHILDLIEETPFRANAVFDCRLSEIGLNRPNPLDLSEYGVTFAGVGHTDISPTLIVSNKGLARTNCSLVLKKDPLSINRRPEVLGWDRTREFVNTRHNALIKRMWREWQQIYTVELEGTDLYIRPQFFGEGKVRFKVHLCLSRPTEVQLAVVKVPRFLPRVLKNEVITREEFDVPTGMRWYEIEFNTDDAHCYSLRGVVPNSTVIEKLVFARRG